MPKLDLTQDLTGLQKRMDSLIRKQIPLRVAIALTDVAKDVIAAEHILLKEKLNQPTPFTTGKKTFRRINAEKNDWPNLSSAVLISPIQAQYLHWQIAGGTRPPKGRAIPIPGPNMKLNKFGNLPRNKIATLMGNKKTFAGKPRGAKHPTEGGIYQRTGGKRNPKYKMLIAWKPRANYSPRLPFYKVGKAIVAKRFGIRLNQQLRRAVEKARGEGAGN